MRASIAPKRTTKGTTEEIHIKGMGFSPLELLLRGAAEIAARVKRSYPLRIEFVFQDVLCAQRRLRIVSQC